MGKTKEHTVQVRQMCVDLHKSGNGYKKIATRLHLPISTVRGIVKKFKTTGTVVNKPGRGCNFMLPPRTVRRMVREIKKSPKLTFAELQGMVASWGHKVSKTTIRRYLHANRLFGRHARKKPFLTQNHKRNGGGSVMLWGFSLPKALGTLLGWMASWTRWNTRTF